MKNSNSILKILGLVLITSLVSCQQPVAQTTGNSTNTGNQGAGNQAPTGGAPANPAPTNPTPNNPPNTPTNPATPASGGQSKKVVQLTDNNVDDSWGANNTWKTLADGFILWLERSDIGAGFGGDAVKLHVLQLGQGEVFNRDVSGLDVDFLAMGSGIVAGEFMATWREDLTTTFVADGSQVIDNGDNNAEENTVDEGCLFYRDSTKDADHDIALFEFPNSDVLVSEVGFDDREPVSDGCEAIWIRDGKLVYFDGLDIHPIADGPFATDFHYDFKEGVIVYSQGEDVYYVDTTQSLQSVAITQDRGASRDRFPRTDGEVVVWIKDDSSVELHEIATSITRTISQHPTGVIGTSLQADEGNVLWQEDQASFFIFDGVATEEVNPAPALNVMAPYLDNNTVAWFGQTAVGSDTEIFVY